MEKTIYQEKIKYFDAQVQAPWAFPEYGEEEWKKLSNLFQYTGSLRGLRVLEPGCGTGRLTQVLAERVGAEGQVVALDISPKMVEAARNRLEGRKNVEIHLSSIEELPLEKEGFDLILCHQVFPHFENKGMVLNIMAESLKTEGKLVVFHFIDLARINDRHRKAGTAVEHDMMPPLEVMESLFREAGLLIDLSANDDQGYFLGSTKA